jgi:glutamine cyclotransferase
VVNEYPHDAWAYTQGLIYHDGILYEGTGILGASSVRKVELETGQVLQQRDLAPEYFGEGITLFGDRLYQLTWRSRTGFVYAADTLEPITTFSYATEGWGLTHDGERLILSDGSATLFYLDPGTLQVIGQVQVMDGDALVYRLNELEYIHGEVWANVFQTQWIVRIDPASGVVVGWIDLGSLLDPNDLTRPIDVLNGIAYDAEQDRIYVTGKWWPRLFEIEVLPVE